MTRATRMDRLDELIGATWGPSPAERKLLEAVKRRFEKDRLRFSDILEWSLATSTGGVDLARFSYGFPSWRTETAAVEATLLEWARAMGPGVVTATSGFLRAARAPFVEQVLMGYARGAGDASPRTKLYLQFARNAGAQALSLARRITGHTSATSDDGLPLHLLGLDVGQDGLAGYKLYFERKQVDPTTLLPWPEGLTQATGDVLLIHRGTSPNDEAACDPSAVDFALAPDATVGERFASMRSAAPGLESFASLSRAFRLRARRVSFSLGEEPTMNLYYVLDEAD